MSLYISFTLWASSHPVLLSIYLSAAAATVLCARRTQGRGRLTDRRRGERVGGRRSKSFRPSKVYRSSNGTRGHSGRDIRPLPAVAVAQFGQPWMTNSAIILRRGPHPLSLEPLASIKRDSYRRTQSRKFIIIIAPFSALGPQTSHLFIIYMYTR